MPKPVKHDPDRARRALFAARLEYNLMPWSDRTDVEFQDRWIAPRKANPGVGRPRPSRLTDLQPTQ